LAAPAAFFAGSDAAFAAGLAAVSTATREAGLEDCAADRAATGLAALRAAPLARDVTAALEAVFAESFEATFAEALGATFAEALGATFAEALGATVAEALEAAFAGALEAAFAEAFEAALTAAFLAPALVTVLATLAAGFVVVFFISHPRLPERLA